jgi:hypothetical protein
MLVCASFALPQDAAVAVRVNPAHRLKPIEIDRFGVGQGGFSSETMIDEWNMALGISTADPRFQPAFIVETTYQMRQAGLDLSCYYHIRDYHFAFDEFLEFFTRKGALNEENFWERRPVYLGLFDLQDRVRPAYFLFKLSSRLSGTEVRVESESPVVHALAADDDQRGISGVLVWNFSQSPTRAVLEVQNAPAAVTAHTFVLDSLAPNHDDTSRLRPLEPEIYGVSFVFLEDER